MHKILTTLLATLCLATAASAEDDDITSDLTALTTAYDARGWEAVGRLNIGNTGMCTGALVAPRLVLTAAHCLYDFSSGDLVPAREIEFLAGWRNGSAQAYRGVRRAIAHPDYEFVGSSGELRTANDVALLELDSEIRLSNVTPFETAKRPRKGASVGVVSYAEGRAEEPSLQEICHVLARRSGSLILSCDVTFGASGAPIFVFEDGQPRIVSVVSAMATIRDRRVSLGTSLERPLADLMALMGSGDAVLGGGSATRAPVAAATPRIRTGGGGGAKFVKP